MPLPPGTLQTLWNADERFVKSYTNIYPGYYYTSDGGYRDSDGYVYIMGRIDDVINVAGHRLSTGEMEEIVSTHQAVAECAVIGAADSLKGQLPLGFGPIRCRLLKSLRKSSSSSCGQIGPIACFRRWLS
jgi:propionyl-CoA synthetase